MPACRKVATARAVALAMARLGRSRFEEFFIEQDQTKALAARAASSGPLEKRRTPTAS